MESATRVHAEMGSRLRAIRTRRRATLRQVADRAGLSESFLSQVERGVASPSVASLQRIAGALAVSVADLFEPQSTSGRPRVLRRENRPSLALGARGRKCLLTQRPLENLEVFIGELEPGGATADEPFVHGDSEELVVVLSGTIELQLEDRLLVLDEGDSIEYRSSVPHRAINVGDEVAEVMWIISPPSL
jgi:transcriptional regulator with XRE-family HTH domain